MLDRSTPSANDQIIAFDLMSVADGDISDLLEPEKEIPDQLGYEHRQGISPSDFCSEEGIRERKPFGQFPTATRREASRDKYQPTWMTQSPTTDEGLASISRPPALEIQWRQILERFDIISRREDNWDERGSKKSDELALRNAKDLMEKLLDAVISEGYPWFMPFISSDEDGYITAAWHKGKHELHLDITETEVEYTKVWGIKIDTEMHEGVLKSDDYLELWEWLLDA